MGIYHGIYENDCPRCKAGKVTSIFISVSPVSYSEGCNNCSATDFSEDEVRSLGDNHSWDPQSGQIWDWPKPEAVDIEPKTDSKNLAFKRNKKGKNVRQR